MMTRGFKMMAFFFVPQQPNNSTRPSQLANVTSEIKSHFTSSIPGGISLQNFPNYSGTTDVTASIRADFCSEYGGCKLASGPLWYCHCDELCEEYNDCCMDYSFNLITRPTDTKYSCVEITNSKDFNVGIQTISNCPSSFKDQTMIAKCATDQMGVTGPPVINQNGPSRIFRNKYCALCHGSSYFDMDVIFYDYISLYKYDEASKMSNDEYQRYLFDTCTYRLLIPESVKVRYCFKELKQNDNLLCHKYSNPVLKGLFLYRNSYCMEDSDHVDLNCLFIRMGEMAGDNKNTLFFKRLSILFSFREAKPPSDLDPLECREWNEKNDRTCTHLPKYTNASIDLDYTIRMPENTSRNGIIQAALLSTFSKYVDGFTEIVFPLDLWVDKNFSLLNLKGRVKVLQTIFSHQVFDLKRRINNQAVSIRDGDDNRRFSSTSALDNNNSFEFMKIYNPFLSRVSKHDLYLGFGIEIHDFTFTKLCNDVEIIIYRDNANQIQIGSLSCKTPALKHVVLYVLAILTLTLFAVSSFALVVMIVVNRRYNYHREIAGSYLENIGIFLLLSNVSFVLGNFISKINLLVCSVLSVVSHYVWMTSFSFTSIAVFHVVKSLLELKANLRRNENYKRKRRRAVTIIGLLVPLLFVGPAVVVDQVGPPYYSPGYSNNDICFPIRFPGNMIFFTGPVIAILIMNTVGLVVVIGKIRMATLSRGTMRLSSSFSEAKVFLRIMSVSGCFWITGILASYFETEWLEYVFTIICGLQGTFIALASLTTRRFNTRGSKETSLQNRS